MSGKLPASLERLARSNPIPVDQNRGRRQEAQEALARILASERPRARRSRRASRRLTVIVVAAVLVGAGGAIAATDPFGFWRSANPSNAMYGVDTSRHAQTPTAQLIGCRRIGAATFTCAPNLGGRRYTYVDVIATPSRVSRKRILRTLSDEARRGQISIQAKRRLEADLAKVPDSFLAHLSVALRFGTYGNSGGLVPPPGTPEWLACEQSGAAIRCRDLNGNVHVAIGSAIYSAMQARDWVPAPRQSPAAAYRANLQMMNVIFGGPLTRREIGFLSDALAAGHTTTTSSSGPAQAVPRR